MRIRNAGPSRRGFTLIELLIVIVIVAILALLVIPRLLGVVRKGRETRVRTDLVEMRKGIARFYSDTGVYPAVLQDIVAPNKGALSASLPEMARTQYKGPYLVTSGGIQLEGYRGLPANPFVSPLVDNVASHWNYNSADGTVRCPVSGTTCDGIPYNAL